MCSEVSLTPRKRGEKANILLTTESLPIWWIWMAFQLKETIYTIQHSKTNMYEYICHIHKHIYVCSYVCVYLCMHVCVSRLVMSNSFQPMYCSLCNSLGKIIGVGSPSLPHESGVKPRSPALKADSTVWATRYPDNWGTVWMSPSLESDLSGTPAFSRAKPMPPWDNF